MARCGCSKTCACAVEANGAPIIPEGIDLSTGITTLFPTSRVGWRDNVVDGTGSLNDPYSVSFKDSLEYRVHAQEWRQTGVDFNTVGWTISDPTVYSTPGDKSIFIWTAAFPNDAYVVYPGLFVGCWARCSTGGVAAPIVLLLGVTINDSSGPFNLAGNTTSTIDPVLSCVGYLNPLDSVVSVGSSGITASIVVSISNPASVALTVTDIRLWAVEV